MKKALVLTSPQVIAAVMELDGYDLHFNTLQYWAKAGIAVPSVSWPQKKGRAHKRLYNLTDLARVRLIVRLRAEGISMPKVRNILARLDDDLRDVLKPKTKAVLHVDGWNAVIRRPGRADVELPSGQLLLPLAEVLEGNAEAAENAVKVA